MCSYGFLQTEPFEPQIIAAHKGVRPKRDKVDGEKYIDSTINWLIQKVSIPIFSFGLFVSSEAVFLSLDYVLELISISF
jgi:hypothetical protein